MLKLRVFLTGYSVAMKTSEVKKVTKTYSAIIGHLFDTIIVASTDNKDDLINQSQFSLMLPSLLTAVD